MEITVKFNNYQELDDFCNGVAIAPALLDLEKESVPKKAKNVSKEPKNVSNEGENVKTEPEAVPVKEEKPAKEEVKIEDVRAVLGKLQKEGKKEEVKQLIASFGVDKLSQVKPEDYAELLKKAGELNA